MKIAQEHELLANVITALPEARRVLAFAPHPDDEVFGCGGLLTLLRRAGADVMVHVLTDGSRGGSGDDPLLVARREIESRAAAEILGFPQVQFWGLPDRGLLYGELLIDKLLTAIQSQNADLVVLPSPAELHPDHQALAFAGIEALRRLGRDCSVVFFEVGVPLPQPNLLVDISAVELLKQKAMDCFVSQLEMQPYDVRVRGLNQYRGFLLGPQVKAAEAFMLLPAQALANGMGKIFDGPLIYRRLHGYASSPEDLPLVSIIIRSMDRPTLFDALGSLAVQTYPNVEVILVNAEGGMHSQPGEQCGPFPLRLINQGGEALTRPQAANLGMAAARGFYLGFLDDDDTLFPDHLHLLVNALRTESEEAVAYSGVHGVERNAPGDDVIKTFAESSVTFPKLLLGNVIPIHAALFPTTLLARGVAFDESLECYEDWDFWLQLARLVPFVFVDRITANYYQGGSSEVSPLAPNAEIVRQSLQTFFAKWLAHITPEELKAVADFHHQTSYDLNSALNYSKGRLHETEGRLHESEGRLHESEGRLHEMEGVLHETEGRLHETEGRLHETEGVLHETQGVLHETEGRLHETEEQLKTRVQELDNGLRFAQNEYTLVHEELARVTSSRSWRLTRPLRLSGVAARRFRGGLLQAARAGYHWLPLTPGQRSTIKQWYFRRGMNGLSKPDQAGPDPTRPKGSITEAALDNAPIRILLLERSVPRPNQDAGSVMIFNFIKIFRDLGCAVTFFPVDLTYDPDYTPALEALGVTCLHPPAVCSLEEHLVMAGSRYDLILTCRPDHTDPFLPQLKVYCPQAKILYETHDLHFVREQRQAEIENKPELLTHAAWRKAQELRIAATVDCTLVVSEQERRILLQENPRLSVEVIPVISEVFGCQAGFAERRDLVFIGGYEHRPNVDAVLFFVQDILPLVIREIPEIRLHVVGSHPPPEITSLASANVVVHGFVPDIAELMTTVRISVNPLRFGAGVKGKIITSMCYGVPCIGTGIAVEGMELVAGEHALVADDPAAFASEVIRLYASEELWTRLSTSGLDFVQQRFSLEVAKETFVRMFERLLPPAVQETFPLKRITSYGAYLGQDRASELERRHRIESALAMGIEPIIIEGHCVVCAAKVLFHTDLMYGFARADGSMTPNWRERVVCPSCQLNNRTRASIHLFHLLCNPVLDSRLYLTEQTTPLFAWFKANYPQVVGSEYLGSKVPVGMTDGNGVRNEDLTRLSFPDGQFDAILSFDVFEHIPDYLQAFRECLRCLKPGGTLFFSVPFDLQSEKHIVRARVDASGQVHHLLPPEHHGNPISADGCLCFYHFGWELLDQLRDLGFRDAAAYLYWSKHYGYLGGEQLLFRAVR